MKLNWVNLFLVCAILLVMTSKCNRDDDDGGDRIDWTTTEEMAEACTKRYIKALAKTYQEVDGSQTSPTYLHDITEKVRLREFMSVAESAKVHWNAGGVEYREQWADAVGRGILRAVR